MSDRCRRWLPLALGLGAALFALASRGTASADDQPKPPRGGIGIVDDTFDDVKNWFAQYGVTLSSGLSTSYEYDFNNPTSDKISLHSLDGWHDTGSVDLFQITLHRDATEKGSWGFYIQGDTGRISRRIKSDWNGSGVVGDTDYEREEIELEQAFVAYNVPVGNGLTLKAGKFVTLLGAEVIEPWANPNYSRSFLFGFAIPFTHTGGLATYPITDTLSVTAGGVIGWDVVEDNNHNPSAIGEISWTPTPQWSLITNGIYGPEQPAGNPGSSRNKRGVVDVVGTYKPIDSVSLIGNYDWASEDEASPNGRHANWQGFSGIVSWDMTDKFNTSFRGEWFEDESGVRTGTPGTPDHLWEVSLDFKYKITDYFYVRTEYRHDESDHRPFVSGTNILLAGQDCLAAEFGYYF